MVEAGELTGLLNEWSEKGDRIALEELLRRAMPVLRRMARGRLRRERHAYALQSLDLVNAAWLKLNAQMRRGWESRTHFYAVFSQAMFQVLVEEGRRRKTQKRAGSEMPLDQASVATPVGVNIDLIDFALALEHLARSRPRAAEVAKLHHLSGMTGEEIASTLIWEGRHLPIATVWRDLKLAKVHLFRALRKASDADDR